MKISNTNDTVCDESEIIESALSLDNKIILELGCGKADKTRLIATKGYDRTVIATEVDETQHSKNLLVDDLPNVSFVLGGSENIPFDDASVDIVMMFKSLHHVPTELMDKALEETSRVLKPGGFAYISEPVFEGKFNEILRLFHDEEVVRQAAFNAIVRSVDSGNLKLSEQLFFCTPNSFESFEVFENRIIKVTHTDHSIADDLLQKVKAQFALNMGDNGAQFIVPIRVDLLQKPLN